MKKCLALVFVVCDVAASLVCYSCSHSYLEIDRSNNPACLHHAQLSKYSRHCAEWENICYSLTRECGSKCTPGEISCVSQGYGIELVTCKMCCDRDHCNGMTGIKAYEGLLDQQYNSGLF